MASTMNEEELIIAVSHMKLAGAATVTSVHAALQAKGLSVDISQVKKAEWKAVKRAVRARAVPAAAPQLPLSPPQLLLSAPPVAAPPWRLRGSGRSFLSPRLLGGGCNGVDPRSRVPEPDFALPVQAPALPEQVSEPAALIDDAAGEPPAGVLTCYDPDAYRRADCVAHSLLAHALPTYRCLAQASRSARQRLRSIKIGGQGRG